MYNKRAYLSKKSPNYITRVQILIDKLEEMDGCSSTELSSALDRENIKLNDLIEFGFLRVKRMLVDLESSGIVQRTGTKQLTRWWLG